MHTQVVPVHEHDVGTGRGALSHWAMTWFATAGDRSMAPNWAHRGHGGCRMGPFRRGSPVCSCHVVSWCNQGRPEVGVLRVVGEVVALDRVGPQVVELDRRAVSQVSRIWPTQWSTWLTSA